MPEVSLVRPAGQTVQADEERFTVVVVGAAERSELGVCEVGCARREIIVSHSDWIISKALIVRKIAFNISLRVGWRGSCGYKVDGEVAFEGVERSGESAAFVVDWRTVEFHRCPEGLQVTIGQEGIEVAGRHSVGDEGGEGAGGAIVGWQDERVGGVRVGYTAGAGPVGEGHVGGGGAKKCGSITWWKKVDGGVWKVDCMCF